MKKLITVILCGVLLFTCLAACSKHAEIDGNNLRFTNRVDDMKALDGQTVTVTGYLCKAYSQEDNIFYLMNVPCQDSPFPSDNSKELSDTIAVQLHRNKAFEYTDAVVTVTGTLVFGDFTDAKGYSYSYRISNAVYSATDGAALSGNAKSWYELSSSGVNDEIGNMLSYVNFLCSWAECTVEIGGTVKYFTPAKALGYIENGAFSYGFKDGYFDKIVSQIEALDGNYSDLVKLVNKAHDLADKAYNALKNGEYTTYTDENGTERYSVNIQAELDSEYEKLVSEYKGFLDSWKLS